MSELLNSVEEARDLLRKEREDARKRIVASDWSKADADAFRVRWLGQKRGVVTDLIGRLRSLPKEEKAAFGAAINEVKREAEEAFTFVEEGARSVERAGRESSAGVDVTFPPRVPPVGRLHPLTVVRRRIETAFRILGYEIADGPEIESDWYNFESLNFPPDHPAYEGANSIDLLRNTAKLLADNGFAEELIKTNNRHGILS